MNVAVLGAFAVGRRVLGSAMGWLLIRLAGPLLALWLQLSFAVLALTPAMAQSSLQV
jgi:hypothetical protein